jgi:hypothetical protein
MQIILAGNYMRDFQLQEARTFEVAYTFEISRASYGKFGRFDGEEDH